MIFKIRIVKSERLMKTLKEKIKIVLREIKKKKRLMVLTRKATNRMMMKSKKRKKK
jgi:hypothetical protein